MDYLFFSVLKDTFLKVVNVAYNIACQWHHNVWDRMQTLPTELCLPLEKKAFTFLIPNFHLPGHITKCQWKFSFNFIKGVRWTDGKAPEQGWVNLNTVTSSTKEMGPCH